MQNKFKQLLTKLIRPSMFGIMIQCIVLAPFFASGAVQQGIIVTGTVTSEDDGSSLPGVNVVIKGTARGTTTDSDGNFSISVPDENTSLVFSFIGYTSQEIAVTAQTVISFLKYCVAKINIPLHLQRAKP